MSDTKPPAGPDFSTGIAVETLPAGRSLLGHVGEESVLLVRVGGELFAVGATCTHYGGPLAEGLIVGDQVRCPWHHACFSLRTGAAARAPALNPVACWKVEVTNGKAFVREKQTAPLPKRSSNAGPSSIVIVGGGAAGNAAAETLRREGYAGPVTLIGVEEGTPVDRPNLSKDYLAGTAPEEWVRLRDEAFYRDAGIERVGGHVTAVDVKKKTVTLADGKTVPFGALLLATGATPIRLPLPGADAPHVHTLRSITDSRQLIAAAKGAKAAVVIGGSFIGLEVAAALRARNLPVQVVAPETHPLERVLGPQLSAFIQKLHEEHGVQFHLGRKPASIDAQGVSLDDGSRLAADLVVMGVGVRPATELAERAGCQVDKGVIVNGRLETSLPGIFAAGDIARWPDARGGGSVRIEHWVVAERMGQHAARSMLGATAPFRDVPFFWSQHYDVSINYVGHAEGWDDLQVSGTPEARDCMVSYRSGGRLLAVASIFRDLDSLKAELAIEQEPSSRAG
jgi:NADPH-dependent 2,4-dienoyl-CoA reductase/sulfur reductase-like enzyme/nitrite reductase/ring-hydroxylating ferredoxin subunit